mmetsp:Transcript_8629/g.17387  ORF Transcript_8629/g.17387 Transcript_8629/m.17387 type:complete len:243 (-) Transcript_8629:276-1004(-)
MQIMMRCATLIATLKLDCRTVSNKTGKVKRMSSGKLIFNPLSTALNSMSANKPWNTIATIKTLTTKTTTTCITIMHRHKSSKQNKNNKKWHSSWDHTATMVKSFLDSSLTRPAPLKLPKGLTKRCILGNTFLIRLIPLSRQPSACLARCPVRITMQIISTTKIMPMVTCTITKMDKCTSNSSKRYTKNKSKNRMRSLKHVGNYMYNLQNARNHFMSMVFILIHALVTIFVHSKSRGVVLCLH